MALNVDICIRGGGIVGSTLALLLSRLNLKVALITPTEGQKSQDIRAFALNAKSKSLLESINAWPEERFCTPVKKIQVRSDEGELIDFAHPYAGDRLEGPDQPNQPNQTNPTNALTWIVEVAALEALLSQALKTSPVECLSAPVSIGALPSDLVNAPLNVICEGSQSPSKQSLQILTQRMPYGQFALATHVKFKDPGCKHQGTAHQWFNTLPHTAVLGGNDHHKESEILALLPIGGQEGDSFAIVWSTSKERNSYLTNLGDAEFTAALHESTKHFSPLLEPVAVRQNWPLALTQASSWCGVLNAQQSWVLCGDSAHSVHPLSGMGLNLGLGDAQALYELVRARAESKNAWRALNDLRLLRSYERQRKLAIFPYVQFIDKIQLLFASNFPIAHLIRNKGFSAFNAFSALKAWTISKAVQAKY